MDVRERQERLSTASVASEVEIHMERLITSAGDLAAGLVDRDDAVLAQKVALAGEKYTTKCQQACLSMAKQQQMQAASLDQAKVNGALVAPLRQQALATLANLFDD
mmetsp:Transcript_23469/g.43628  ORF Transcript_23469/g.43628 Transcript_23469/m.43628 type:complete len:106 (-) Transcript_23469:843-1160(-)